jgi:hypothetical protein
VPSRERLRLTNDTAWPRRAATMNADIWLELVVVLLKILSVALSR